MSFFVFVLLFAKFHVEKNLIYALKVPVSLNKVSSTDMSQHSSLSHRLIFVYCFCCCLVLFIFGKKINGFDCARNARDNASFLWLVFIDYVFIWFCGYLWLFIGCILWRILLLNRLLRFWNIWLCWFIRCKCKRLLRV